MPRLVPPARPKPLWRGEGPGIHVFLATLQDVDGRDKPGHDGGRSFASLKPQLWQWRADVPHLRKWLKGLNFA
jgi:hypothetical protein